jgi:hypothetical protein
VAVTLPSGSVAVTASDTLAAVDTERDFVSVAT